MSKHEPECNDNIRFAKLLVFFTSIKKQIFGLLSTSKPPVGFTYFCRAFYLTVSS